MGLSQYFIMLFNKFNGISYAIASHFSVMTTMHVWMRTRGENEKKREVKIHIIISEQITKVRRVHVEAAHNKLRPAPSFDF